MSDRTSPTARPVPPIRQAPAVNPPVGRKAERGLGNAKEIYTRPQPLPQTPSR